MLPGRSSSSNVIETPISTRQLSWLTQSKGTGAEDAVTPNVDTWSGGGSGRALGDQVGGWTLPVSKETVDSGTEQCKFKATAATSSSSSATTSYPNWHLLTNVPKHQKQQQQQGVEHIAPSEDRESSEEGIRRRDKVWGGASTVNWGKNNGGEGSMLAIRYISFTIVYVSSHQKRDFRSGIPLALQYKKRKRGGVGPAAKIPALDTPTSSPTILPDPSSVSSTLSPVGTAVSPSKRTGDLGVRKDLTIPSGKWNRADTSTLREWKCIHVSSVAPTAEEDNVFEDSDDGGTDLIEITNDEVEDDVDEEGETVGLFPEQMKTPGAASNNLGKGFMAKKRHTCSIWYVASDISA